MDGERSYEDRRRDFYFPPHEVTVHKLKDLLGELQDDDLLVPNEVRNLAIIRGGKQVGYVDLLAVNLFVELYADETDI